MKVFYKLKEWEKIRQKYNDKGAVKRREEKLMKKFNKWDKKCELYERKVREYKDVKREENRGVISWVKDILGVKGEEEEIPLPDNLKPFYSYSPKPRKPDFTLLDATDPNLRKLTPLEKKVLKNSSKTTSLLSQIKSEWSESYSQYLLSTHGPSFTKAALIKATSDLTSPSSLYPLPRLSHRKITYHSGPTNSGKTYNALLALKSAPTGMYLGPLRLLALEVYEELTSSGVYCSLITGQERRNVPFSTHVSATVEMARMEEFDVVVIDEIQLLGDEERGAGWTRAFMGVECKEVHVCGGGEGVERVRRMAEECGDDFEVVEYERFNELKVEEGPLNKNKDYKTGVREGDAIVAFSKNDIFAIRREIEENTEFKCCVIYGALPPESRAQQAKLFNDPSSDYKVLVASDAVGLGLNLNIGRVVFHTMFKGGRNVEILNHSLVKQIAGRAGRRNSVYKHGAVTCRRKEDMRHLRKMLETDITPIERAGLLPNVQHVEAFADVTGIESMSELFSQFTSAAQVSRGYFLCRQEAISKAASMADTLENLKVTEKFTLCIAPFNESDEMAKGLVMGFAEALQRGRPYGLDVKIPEGRVKTFEDLGHLCALHHLIDLYLWLSQRFEVADNALETATAMRRKRVLLGMITEALEGGEGALKLKHDYNKMDERYRARWRKLQRERQGRDRGGKGERRFLPNRGTGKGEASARGPASRNQKQRRFARGKKRQDAAVS
ncbi:hypothetical protein TrVE_jg617 [Triparma verrucosa]|uniref:RNA helicase n=1 Tax=Triparma verrucosa TaxID=1606542 RepID=A0A9W7FEQ6_9STRA|nr:hypothetical protein TrVE_jg617 [Triparma verrucosa]